jgi:hypothetical protein
MLSQIARHGNIYLDINVKGDLHVDEHHTVEDTGLQSDRQSQNPLAAKPELKDMDSSSQWMIQQLIVRLIWEDVHFLISMLISNVIMSGNFLLNLRRNSSVH